MALGFMVMMLYSLPVNGQNKHAAEEPTTLLVHGEATVSVEPDIAELDVGILTQAQTSQAAADQNATKAKQVVAVLQRLVAPGDIKSVNLSVNPNYRYGKDGGAGVVTGYTASNTIRVAVRDLSQLRKVIEAATQSGASSINRLAFDLKDEKAARARALAEAAGQAQAGAEALASSLKLRIGRLTRVEEVQPVVISPAREVEASALQETFAHQEAISPGTIQIHASLNLIYAVYQR
ncbi:MAG: SIMPL domain-containing protein [Bryobacteraceae bacterium]